MFRQRTVLSLYNCFTKALKRNLPMLSARTQALHGLMDGYVGLAGRN